MVDYAQLQRFGGADGRTADDHVQGLGDASQAWQTLCAAGTGQQAQLDFRQADLGVFTGNAVMAANSDFQATAQSGTVNNRDTRLAAGFDTIDYVRQAWCLRRLAEFLDISPGDEG